jgi:hypothetical protein
MSDLLGDRPDRLTLEAPVADTGARRPSKVTPPQGTSQFAIRFPRDSEVNVPSGWIRRR